MKKITALFLFFALTSISFKTEAINYKKLDYGSGAVILGFIGGYYGTKILVNHGLYHAAKTAMTKPSLFFDVYVKDLIEKRKISSEFLFDASWTIASLYGTKKLYDLYKQIDQESAADKK